MSLDAADSAFFYEGHEFVGHIGDEDRRHFDAIQILQMVLNLPSTDTFGYTAIIWSSMPVTFFLIFLEHGFKLSTRIPWNRDFPLPVLADHRLLAFSITSIRCIVALT